MTQTEKIIEQLEDKGSVTRNWALQNYISRLGALILALKKEGWVFTQEYTETPYGKDYTYFLVSRPTKNQLLNLPQQSTKLLKDKLKYI
jgi:hypothetical protein